MVHTHAEREREEKGRERWRVRRHCIFAHEHLKHTCTHKVHYFFESLLITFKGTSLMWYHVVKMCHEYRRPYALDSSEMQLGR